MWLDRVSNQGSLALESNALPTALCGPACIACKIMICICDSQRTPKKTGCTLNKAFAIDKVITLKFYCIIIINYSVIRQVFPSKPTQIQSRSILQKN